MKQNTFLFLLTLTLAITFTMFLIFAHSYEPFESIADIAISIYIAVSLTSLPFALAYYSKRAKENPSINTFEEGFWLGWFLGKGIILLILIIAPFFAVKYIISEI